MEVETHSTATLGAGSIVEWNQKILLVQMNYGKFKGEWILPGGMVNEGEHPSQTAIRECKEETGLDIEIIGQLAVRHRIYSNLSANIYWVFVAQLVKDSQNIPQLIWPKEELQDVKFWDMEEALMDESVRPLTRIFIKKFKSNPQLHTKVTLGHNQSDEDEIFIG